MSAAKQENPKWFPPAEMVARQPDLAKYQTNGMPGGEGNPLGVRALYLHDEKGKDTLYRIHGTIEPNSIGLNVSSGCIRMLNENVTELYGLVDDRHQSHRDVADYGCSARFLSNRPASAGRFFSADETIFGPRNTLLTKHLRHTAETRDA